MQRYLSQSIHVSWHIAALSIGVLLGVGGLKLLPPQGLFGGSGPPELLIGGSLFVVACMRRPRALLVVSVVAGIFLGMWRGAIEQQALQAYAPYYGHLIRLSGLVRDDASLGKHGEPQLQLAHVHIGQQAFHGKVWASVASGASIKRGDVVYLRATLNTGFGSMAASMYRAEIERIERPYPGDVARRIRDWFANGVRAGVSEPQSSLGLGFLTGQHSALPPTLDAQLRIAGLTHVVVASGYNLTILVGFARRVFSKLSKYVSALFAVLMIGGFMLVAGFSASMSRAGLVAGLSLAAWYWGRTIHPLVLLPFAACITVLAEPAYLWGDIGWYLSFTAFAGVVVMAPLMRRYFWAEANQTGVLKQILTDTVSAQLCTLPLLLLVFGQVSTYALLANVLVLPLVPLAMILVFLSGVAGLALPGITHLSGWPANLLLGYMTHVVAWVASLPGAQEQVPFTVPLLVLCYAFLIGVCAFWKRKTAFTFREF